MNKRLAGLSRGIVLLASLACLTMSPAAHRPLVPRRCTPWVSIPAPAAIHGNAWAMAYAAVAPGDVWAVGAQPGTILRPIVGHWTGGDWQITSPPTAPHGHAAVLSGVAAVSARDVWAVGHVQAGNTVMPLVEHWNGRTWAVVRSPQIGQAGDEYALNAVAAVSSHDVWAVGTSLVEHWDGHAWTVFQHPAGTFNAITVVSSHDVWAVGQGIDRDNNPFALTAHWDGRHWMRVPSPSNNAQNPGLNSISALSSNDIWAVGASSNDPSPDTSIVQHWNGRLWAPVKAPSPDPGGLAAVVAVSAHAVWISLWVDGYVAHWTGRSWAVVYSGGTGAAGTSVAIPVPASLKGQARAIGFVGMDADLLQSLMGSPCLVH